MRIHHRASVATADMYTEIRINVPLPVTIVQVIKCTAHHWQPAESKLLEFAFTVKWVRNHPNHSLRNFLKTRSNDYLQHLVQTLRLKFEAGPPIYLATSPFTVVKLGSKISSLPHGGHRIAASERK